ncbi:MAG TPA: hypothetical protein VD767_09055, partial [Thermomicrobiales bacterium]|nr:hypothetical protein [Thermomicrobiales bacterium]
MQVIGHRSGYYAIPVGTGTIRQRCSRPAMIQQWRLILLTIVVMLASSPPALAQPATPAPASTCLASVEPNDAPEDAFDLGTGPVCAHAGNLQGGQDLYRWEAGPTDDITRYTFGISAIADQVSVIEIYAVEFDDAGHVTAATKLASVNSTPSAPAHARNILLQPAVYYIAVAVTGPGPYVLAIENGDPAPGAVEGDSVAASGALSLSGTLGDRETTIDWTVDNDTSTTHVDLAIQGPAGARLDWELIDPAGLTLIFGRIPVSGVSTIPDLGLDPGVYRLTLRTGGDVPVPWVVTTTATSARSDVLEDEPNETVETARPIAGDGDALTLTGRLATASATRDTDLYALDVGPDRSGRLTDIRLIWPGGALRRLCLVGQTGADVRCAESETGLSLNDLVLQESTWLLRISGEVDAANPYVLKIDITGEPVAGFEAEPNDDVALATPLRPDGDAFTGSGRMVEGDVDLFRMTVSGEPQLWAIEVTGDDIYQLELLVESGDAVLLTNRADPTLVLYDAYLLPGDHLLRVSGGAGDYAIAVTPLGPPDPSFEHEPNDSL